MRTGAKGVVENSWARRGGMEDLVDSVISISQPALADSNAVAEKSRVAGLDGNGANVGKRSSGDAVETFFDLVIDELSAGVQKRRSRVKAAALTPALSAVMVMLNVELGYAPEMMRGALENPKGKALLEDGLRALGTHLLKELIK